jgi:hypothetical protein
MRRVVANWMCRPCGPQTGFWEVISRVVEVWTTREPGTVRSWRNISITLINLGTGVLSVNAW